VSCPVSQSCREEKEVVEGVERRRRRRRRGGSGGVVLVDEEGLLKSEGVNCSTEREK